MATLKDVARLAGVSVSTVSRVVNESSLVDHATREKVNHAIKMLNYKPNLVAYGLRVKNSRLLGLILPELGHEAYAELAQYVEAASEERGYSVLIGLHRNDCNRGRMLIDGFQRRSVDGIIIQPVIDVQNVYSTLREYTTVPMVLYGHSFSNHQMGTVQFDNYRAGYMVAEYFAKLGHRHVACTIGPQGMEYLRERFCGFRDGLSAHQIEIHQRDIIECDFNYQVPGKISGQEAVHKLIDGSAQGQIPTAIWAHNDLIALGIIKELKNFGIRVPEDISVVGMDNMALTDMVYPPLTTIAQPRKAMAEKAVRMIIQEIEMKDSYQVENVKMEPELIIRESTASCCGEKEREGL